jgi:A/G-specific adenine glycosylase
MKTEKAQHPLDAERLLAWYDSGHRDLPWRRDRDPYHVWVSEIMLQQTRVEAVKPYYARFLKRLPNIAALAECPEDDLLKLWEGLGYYSRVRNLQKASQQILKLPGGEMPRTKAELEKLAGIGSYTASAVSSICFGCAEPAVDGNVLRVYMRLLGDPRCISDAKVKKAVEDEIRPLMPTDRPGDFNQAMMELGACVCLPNGAPECGACPFAEACRAHLEGRETDFPVKAAKAPRVIEERTILVIRDGEKAAIRKRPGKGLLAGLYELPSMDGYQTAAEVQQYLDSQGMKVLRVQPLEDAKHIFSHREWHMKGYLVRVDELERGKPGADASEWIYIEPEETRERYPIPSAFEAFTKALQMKLGRDNLE